VLRDGHEVRPSLARQELLAKIRRRCRPGEARVRLFRVRGVALDTRSVLERGLVPGVEDHVGTDPVADGENERQARPRADDRMWHVARAVEVVPPLQRHLLPLDDQQTLAAQDEKALLVCLSVVHRHWLAGLERREVDPELREVVVAVELDRRAELVLAPLHVADVTHEPAHSRSSSRYGTSRTLLNRAYASRAS